jgi:hypothetical protein
VKFLPTAIVVLSAAGGICWGVERHATDQLQVRLDAIRDRESTIDRLRRERDRLHQRRPTPEELARLRDEAQRRDQDGPVGGDRSASGAMSLRPGLWAPASAWQNQGRATPEAALETMLWAAAGGELEALKKTVVPSADARSKAAEVWSSLPQASQQYATPEDLLAVVVAGNVPLDSAQLVARQQAQDDQVTEYLRLRTSGGQTRQVFLSLQRTPDGWRLVVPMAAFDRIAK